MRWEKGVRVTRTGVETMSTAGDRQSRRIWIALALVAFGVQLAFVVETNRSDLFRIPVVDAATYHNLAAAMVQGEAPTGTPFWQPPLYPAWLALVYRFTGGRPTAARMVQILFPVLTALLTYAVARRVTSRRLAAVASVLTSLCGPLVFFAGQLLPASLAVVLDIAALLALLVFGERRTLRTAGVCGLAFGLAALAVPNILLMLPAALAWLAWDARRRRAWGPNARLAAALLGGAALCILPVTVRNGAVSGQWVPISTNGGINFYIGNNPDADATQAIQPGQDWSDLIATPYRHGATSASEAQGFFFRSALGYAVAHPGAFLKGLCVKAWHLCRGREIPRNVCLYAFRDHSRLLRWLVWAPGWTAFPSGLIIGLGLFGLLTAVGRERGRALLAVFVAVYAFSIVLFFPSTRYRLPLLPPLIVFAVLGVEHLVAVCRVPGRRRSVHLALLAGLIVLVHLPASLPTDGIRFDAGLHRNVGVGLQVRGRGDEAMAAYRRALELDPQGADTHYFMGTALRDAGDKDRAIQSFRACVVLRPDHEKALHDLALLLHERRETQEAMLLLRRVLERNPQHRRAMKNLGIILAQLGELDEAQIWLRKAGAIPDNARIKAVQAD